MNFEILTYFGTIEDCECCGTYSGEGFFLLINQQLIWKKYSDGHLYGENSNLPLLDSILNYIEKYKSEEIEKNHTEEARLLWNKKYPGNGIARNSESWLLNKKEHLDYLAENIKKLKDNAKVLPYNETLCVKMILLWIEDIFGEKINVIEDTITLQKINQLNLLSED